MAVFFNCLCGHLCNCLCGHHFGCLCGPHSHYCCGCDSHCHHHHLCILRERVDGRWIENNTQLNLLLRNFTKAFPFP